MSKPILIFLLPLMFNLVLAEHDFKTYVKQFNKSYKSPLEWQLREKIYLSNLELIDKFNEKPASFELGINHLTDHLPEEVLPPNCFLTNANFSSYKNSPESERFFESLLVNASAPTEIDWTKIEGRVAPVKDGGLWCNAGWAFSATGALEGQMAGRSKLRKMVPLSEQFLIDCSFSNHGCKCGFMLDAWTDIATFGGINDEKSYKYKAYDDRCKFDKDNIAFSAAGGYLIKQADPKLLMTTLANFGPISVTMDAAVSSFTSYKKGIYQGQDCNDLTSNHAVLLVGYGHDKELNLDFWKIKNNWGTWWGEQGYMRILRTDSSRQPCGIDLGPMIPTF